MGQKIHPKCFRLGITQNHLSNWFCEKKLYSALVFEDITIRNILKKIFSEKQITISEIEIERINENSILSIFVSTSNINKFLKLNLEEIEKLLKKTIPTLNTVCLIPKNVEDKTTDTMFVAEQIVKKLENRYPFKRAMKEAIRQAQASGIEGIKIQVSGRLNGAEIARTEWKREGRVPLHTIRAKIGYSYQTAATIYGIIGVKVWLFLGEIKS